MKASLKRLLCRHQYEHIGLSYFGMVFHCPKCGGIFYEYGNLHKHYIGQWEEVFNEQGQLMGI